MDLERLVDFIPGYNYLHETGPKSRGQHGMSIRFVLRGDEGATQFLMYTHWTPLGEVDKDKTYENGYHRSPIHVDRWDKENYGLGKTMFPLTSPPMGADLGYHWSAPTYESEYMVAADCDLLPGGQCYYDGSGLRADDLLKVFIDEGDKAVWEELEEEYNLRKSEADEYAKIKVAQTP